MLQYTHYPEAKHQKHPINRYWFVYRHKSGLSKLETLRVLSNEASLRMLYGEVKRNVLTNRYLFLDSDCVMKLGALQLHIMYGNCESSISEMLRSKKEVFESIIPIGAACSLALMSEIISTYKSLSGITESDARKKFIQVCQSSPLFGSSYFVACEERPPLGFFEYRVQKWLVAVNEGGLFAIDTKFKVYLDFSLV